MRENGKKLLSLVLALVLVLGMLSAAAWAAEPTSGPCGENVTWSLNNGVLTISGTGAMADFEGYDGAPWYSYREEIISVSIGEGVTEIGNFAFDGTALTSIVIPNGVTRIGVAAFQECTSLTSVSIPNSVQLVEEAAFRRTPWIKAQGGIAVVNGTLLNYEGDDNTHVVTIPDSVTKIAAHAFRMRAELTTVHIPNGVTSIEDDAFFGCHGLREITIPDGVTSIGARAFSDTGLTSVTIPGSVKSIGAYAFTGLKDLYYPGSEAQWDTIEIEYSEPALLENTTIHYNTAGPDTSDTAPTFSDVPASSWYHDSVYWALETGITNGTGTNPPTFSPLRDCKQVEILAFLWRANNQPASSARLPFTPKNSWAEGALRWAVEKGMIDASFDEDAPCTRATAVKFIWQAAGSPSASGGGFADVPAGADYAQAVAWAVGREITNGTGNNTFSPAKTCNRAEIVTFLYRAYK